MVDQPSPLVLPWFIRHNNYKESITLQNKTKSFKNTKHLFLPIFLFYYYIKHDRQQSVQSENIKDWLWFVLYCTRMLYSPFSHVELNKSTRRTVSLPCSCYCHWEKWLGSCCQQYTENQHAKYQLTTYQPGSGYSKLTASLVNVSLKFQMLISEIRQNFCWKNVWSFCTAKASPIFRQKFQCIWL